MQVNRVDLGRNFTMPSRASRPIVIGQIRIEAGIYLALIDELANHTASRSRVTMKIDPMKIIR